MQYCFWYVREEELHEYNVLTHYRGVFTGSQYIVSLN